MEQNLKMTLFHEITIELKLPNKIQWSWYHSFQKDIVLSDEAKTCDTLGLQSTDFRRYTFWLWTPVEYLHKEQRQSMIWTPFCFTWNSTIKQLFMCGENPCLLNRKNLNAILFHKFGPSMSLYSLLSVRRGTTSEMLKYKAQIARESINTTLELPGPLSGPWNPAESKFDSALVMCVRAHNLLRPPPPKKESKILHPPLLRRYSRHPVLGNFRSGNADVRLCVSCANFGSWHSELETLRTLRILR